MKDSPILTKRSIEILKKLRDVQRKLKIQSECDEGQRDRDRRYCRQMISCYRNKSENPLIMEEKRKHYHELLLKVHEKEDKIDEWTSDKYKTLERRILRYKNNFIDSLNIQEL